MQTRDLSLSGTRTISVSPWMGGVLSLFLAGAVVYAALFSEYPAIHDTMHKARHSLAIVPCH